MITDSQAERIREAFSFYRSFLIDFLEGELSHSKSWPAIRSKIFRLFSEEKGLEHKIIQICVEGRDNE